MRSKPTPGNCTTCHVVNTKNAYKIVPCSVNYCFTGLKIYTGVLSSKAIHALLPINSKWMMSTTIITMNWGLTDPVHICIMRSWKHIKNKE